MACGGQDDMLGGGSNTGLCTIVQWANLVVVVTHQAIAIEQAKAAVSVAATAGTQVMVSVWAKVGVSAVGVTGVVTARQVMVSGGANVVVLCVKVKTPNGAAEAEVEADE
jgi:hypothetical protein